MGGSRLLGAGRTQAVRRKQIEKYRFFAQKYRFSLKIEIFAQKALLFTVNKIKTIGELVQLSENDLGRMPQMGRATLHEITDRLAEFGLYLVDSVAHKVASNQK